MMNSKLHQKMWSILVLAALTFIGCKQSMMIQQVDYSQSIESVLTPDEDGMVTDAKHGLSFNIKPIQYSETQDTSAVTTSEIRYIRGEKGYYYVTAPNYRNVYVMQPGEGTLELKKKLNISENGIKNPALNQRGNHVQLVNLETKERWIVKPKSVEKMKSQKGKEDQ